MMFLRTNSPNWSQSRRLFHGPLPRFVQIKYFMTCVYWVIHDEELYHQITSKLRFELVLPSLSASLRACLIHLILQHPLDGNKWAHKLLTTLQPVWRLWGPIRVSTSHGSIPSRSPIFNASWLPGSLNIARKSHPPFHLWTF
jgi:hypothetical protein